MYSKNFGGDKMDELLKEFKINDNFLGHYVDLVLNTVLPYQEKILKDEIPGIEKSHAVKNFELAAEKLATGKCSEEFYGMVFQDSDVAKWLEAAAYSLEINDDKELEKRCDEVIDIIGRAQHKDGYLNTYFTVKEPGRQWTDLCEAHELYCAGHMIEAAVAYAECTGKTKLLHIMCGMADNIYDHFITNKAEGYPGHPEVELALMRLYDYTENDKYKTLAEHFINVRGVDSDFFIKEGKKRDWDVWGNFGEDKEYAQNQKPLREQDKAVGHAVRAVYLYTGMASVALETHDETLVHACRVLWDNITKCRMYITGAIGSAYEGEAFTKDYHLPNDTAYAETCAAIGLVFFARKMIDIEKDSTYADVMERALYNCVLAGMEQDGKRFFYVNPLEVIPGISGEAKTHRHALPQRPNWFTCACCPPNVARLLTSISKYAWSVEDKTVYSHLFVGGVLDESEKLKGSIKVETGYPYDGTVKYSFEPVNNDMNITLAIRMPYWSRKTEVLLNGKKAAGKVNDGYMYIKGCFTGDDVVTVNFDMKINTVFANSNVSADSGKVALMRGPIVYCAEGVDNDKNVLDLYLKKNGSIKLKEFKDFPGAVSIKAEGYRISNTKELYSFERPEKVPCEITLIPYYLWDNRGLTQMRVWIPEEQ